MTKQEFELLFRAQYNALCNYAFALVKTTEAAEDIVQEVLMDFWNKTQNGMVVEKPEHYLLRATKFKCIDHFRKVSNAQKTEDERVYVLTSDQNEAEGPDQEVDLEAVVSLAIAQLPEKTRVVFNLAKVEGKSYKEVAEQLNISVKTVENQMSRAFKYLRLKLKDYKFYLMFYLIFFGE